MLTNTNRRLVAIIVILLFSSIFIYHSPYDTIGVNTEVEDMSTRISLLTAMCNASSSPFHPDYSILHKLPSGPGAETVLLPGSPPVSVCIPHKVGSHAWGEFSRALAKLYPQRMEKLQAIEWKSRAQIIKKAVVVRDPLERLVSAYRMIFMDWCDPDKFIRKKWKHICSEKGLSYGVPGNSLVEKMTKVGDDSVGNVLSAMYDEYMYGRL